MSRLKFLIRLAVAGLTLVIAFGFISLRRQASAATFSYAGSRNHLSNPILFATGLDDDEGPIAIDDTDNTNEDVSKDTEVTANDILKNSAITLSVVNDPSNGSAIPKNKHIVTYTPDPNFYGVDHYRYRICGYGDDDDDDDDDDGGCSEANVTIIVNPVNDTPTAVDDSATTNEDTPVTIAVLQNDSDVDGDAIFLHAFDQASQQGGKLERDDNGTPFIQSDDRIIYSPPTNFSGTDSFHYIVSDGSAQSSAQVTVTVIPQEERDTQAPSVTWLSPVGDEGVYQVNGELVMLEIQVSDDQEVDRVEFHRWDVPTQGYVELATLTAAPYRFELDTRTLNLGWNQVNARAYDTAGNASEVGHIWLFKITQIFLPLTAR